MSTTSIAGAQPKAVMSPEELESWNALPAEEQLERLRAAIERGIASGPAELVMDQIWERIRARGGGVAVSPLPV